MPITIDVQARPDAASFKRAANEVEATFATAGKKAADAFGKGFSAGSKDIEDAARQYQTAYDKVADASGKAKTAETELQRLRDKAKDQAKEVEAAEKRLSNAREQEGRDSKTALDAERDLATARDRLARTNTQIVRTAEGLARSNREQARAAREATQAYRQLQEAQQRAGRGFESNAKGLISGFASQSSGLVGQLHSIGSAGGKAFIGGAIAAIVAGNFVQAVTDVARTAVGAMKDVFETGLDFDRVANKLQGVTRASAADMDRFRSVAKALGNDLTLPGVSAKDALDAMLELSKGGLGQQDVLKSVRGTLLLSTAAGISPTEAAQSQASVLQAFNLDPSQADRVADLLTAVQQAAPGEIPDFALALQQAGTVAHGFGISIEDTLATLGMFAKAGVVGSDAGTSFKTLLTHLANPSSESQEAIADLGLQLTDTQGNFIGMRNLIQQLGAAGARMRPDQFQADVAQLFGTDAIRGAMIAKDAGLKMFDQVMAEFARGGQAQQMGAAMMQGMPGIVEKVKNSIDSIKLSLSELFSSGGAQSFGNKLVEGLDSISAWIDSHKPEIIGFFTDFARIAVEAFGEVAHEAGIFLRAVGSAMSHLPGRFGEFGRSIRTAGKELVEFGTQTMPTLAHQIDVMGDRASQAARFARDLGDNIKLLPDGKTIVLKDNTAEVRANIDSTQYALENLPDGTVKIIPLTEEATLKAEAWRRQQGDQPATIPLNVNTEAATKQIQQFLAAAPKSIQITAQMAGIPGAPPAPTAPPKNLQDLLMPPAPPRRALGGIFDVYDSVASFADGKLPRHALLQPPVSGAGLVQWAEPSTGGEAFIPLNGGQRSIKIWAETGRLLGVFDEGGIRGWPSEPGTYVVTPDNIMTALQFAQSVSGRAPYGPAAGPTMYDCSGFMSAIYGILTGHGLPDGQRFFTTESDFTKLGFLPGYDPSSPFNIGVHHGGPGGGHMAGTLMGYNVESGGSHGGPLIGAGAAGATDPQFEEHYHLPGSMYGYGTGGAGGYFEPPDPKRVREAEQRVARADQRVAELEQQQRELKADAKESERMRLRDELANARQDAQDARADLAEARQGKYRSGGGGATSSFPGQIGAPIDQDFGLSKGLPGLAENLTKFFANLAFAPVLGALGAVSAAAGNPSGGGLIGIAASQPGSLFAAAGGFGGLLAGLGGPSAMGPAPLGGGGGMTVPGMGVGGLPGPGVPADAGGPAAGPTQIGGVAPAAGPGGGGFGGLGGMPMAAIQTAASGLNMLAPGAGIAAQIGIQEINRAIAYAGQVAGIGVQGLMETFLPTAGSQLAQNNWITRIVGGIAGARPQLPNTAGQSSMPSNKAPQQAQPLPQQNPGDGQPHQGSGNPPGPINITYNNNNATEAAAGRDLTFHLSNMYQGVML